MKRTGASDAVRAYVAARLREETEGPRKATSLSKIASATGASVSHVSKVRSGTANVGLDFEAAIAAYWGMTVERLRNAAAEGPPPSTTQPIGGRLRDRREWAEQLDVARQFFRTFSDEELSAVGDVYDHMDEPVTAEFIGYMAQALRVRRNRKGGHGDTGSESGPPRNSRRAG